MRWSNYEKKLYFPSSIMDRNDGGRDVQKRVRFSGLASDGKPHFDSLLFCIELMRGYI